MPCNSGWSRWMEQRTTTMSQQGCGVSKEVAESSFWPESWGESRKVPEGVGLKVLDRPLSCMVQEEEPWLPQQNHLRARQCTTSWCEEYLCGINMGMKEKLVVWPLSSPDLNPIENLKYTRVGDSSHQNSSSGKLVWHPAKRNSPKTQVQWMQKLWRW